MKDTYSIKSTTQDFLDIYDIANNVIILKDGTCSIVLTVSAMNFDLLAEQEQDAVIYTYAALLNSLNYPIQINIQSKTKDITSYIKLLEEQQEKEPSKVKKSLIAKYRQFVGELITERNVLDKKFYVSIPASAVEMGLQTTQGIVPGTKAFDIGNFEKTTILEKAVSILEPRKDHLISQFARMGLVAKQLDTQEIIQVFYNNYNPEASDGQKISNSSSYTTPLVRASVNEGLMNNLNQTNAQTQSGETTTPAPNITQTNSQPPIVNPVVEIPTQQEAQTDQNQPNTQQNTTPTTQEPMVNPLVETPAQEQIAVQPITPQPSNTQSIGETPIQNDMLAQAELAQQPVVSSPNTAPQIQKPVVSGVQEEIAPLNQATLSSATNQTSEPVVLSNPSLNATEPISVEADSALKQNFTPISTTQPTQTPNSAQQQNIEPIKIGVEENNNKNNEEQMATNPTPPAQL